MSTFFNLCMDYNRSSYIAIFCCYLFCVCNFRNFILCRKCNWLQIEIFLWGHTLKVIIMELFESDNCCSFIDLSLNRVQFARSSFTNKLVDWRLQEKWFSRLNNLTILVFIYENYPRSVPIRFYFYVVSVTVILS